MEGFTMPDPMDFKTSATILICRCQAEITELTQKIAVESKLSDELLKRYEMTKRSIEYFKTRRDMFLNNVSKLKELRDKDPDNSKADGKVL